MTKTIEVGTLEEIDLKEKYYKTHIQGNPAEQALLIQDLLAKDWTQQKIAKLLKLSQGGISRRLSLLDLIPKLFRLLKEGKLKPSTAWHLSKLAVNDQEEFAKKEKITLKEVLQYRRKLSISSEVVKALEEPAVVSPPFYTSEDAKQVVTCPRCNHQFTVSSGEITLK